MSTIPPDPRFPDRPTHPDFALLSEAAIEADNIADNDGFLEVLRAAVDPLSLLYMAEQRARIGAAKIDWPDVDSAETAAILDKVRSVIEKSMVAAEADGFMLGVKYAQKKRARGYVDDGQGMEAPR